MPDRPELRSVIAKMDTIFIKALRAETIIGIYEWEKNNKQTVIVDLELATDIRKASETDDIDDTLNYKSITKRLVSYIQSSRFELVETLAEGLARLILQEFAVNELKLTLHKPGALSDADDVGIIIKRARDGDDKAPTSS